jgi:hypothetical protein
MKLVDTIIVNAENDQFFDELCENRGIIINKKTYIEKYIRYELTFDRVADAYYLGTSFVLDKKLKDAFI